MEDEIPPETICVATGWGSAAKDVFYYPTKLQQYPIPFKRQCSTEDKDSFEKDHLSFLKFSYILYILYV